MTLHISKTQTAYLVVVVVAAAAAAAAAAAVMAVVVAVMAVHVYNNNFKMLKTKEQVIAIGYLYFL